jgi:hypothetical protein
MTEDSRRNRMVRRLLQQNRQWAESVTQVQPDFFTGLESQQLPLSVDRLLR